MRVRVCGSRQRPRAGPREVALSPRSPIGYNAATSCRSSSWLRFPPDLPSATMRRRTGPGTGTPDGTTSPCSALFLWANAPSSPTRNYFERPATGLTFSTRLTRALTRCGFPPISHRLQCGQRRTPCRAVAVSPRSPIGYNRGSVRGSVGPAWSQVRPGVRRPADRDFLPAHGGGESHPSSNTPTGIVGSTLTVDSLATSRRSAPFAGGRLSDGDLEGRRVHRRIRLLQLSGADRGHRQSH